MFPFPCRKCAKRLPELVLMARQTVWYHKKINGVDEEKFAVDEVEAKAVDAPIGDGVLVEPEAVIGRPQLHPNRVDMQALARDLVLTVVNQGLSWDGTARIMVVVNTHVFGRRVRDKLPETAYMMTKVSDIRKGRYKLERVCAKCDYVYNQDQSACDPCGLPPSGKRLLLVIDISERIGLGCTHNHILHKLVPTYSALC